MNDDASRQGQKNTRFILRLLVLLLLLLLLRWSHVVSEINSKWKSTGHVPYPIPCTSPPANHTQTQVGGVLFGSLILDCLCMC